MEFQSLADTDPIITILYQSALDVTSKPLLTTYPVYPLTVFMRALCHRLDCDYLSILTGTEAPNFPICDSKNGMSDSDRQWFVNSFMNEWSSYPLVDYLSEPGESLTLREVSPPSSCSSNRYYKEFLRPIGIKHETALRFAGPFGEPGILSVLRKESTPEIDEFTKQFLCKLREHLEIGLSISMKVRRSELVYETIRQTIDNMAITTFVLDGKKRVINLTNAIDHVLEQSYVLRLSNQRLYLSNKQQDESFQATIDNCIAWRRDPVGNRPAEVFRIESKKSMNLGLLIHPTPYFPYRSLLNPHVVVYLSDAEVERPAPERLICNLFGVGRREAQLSVLLANGHDLKKAAELMGVTETTARTYLQRIYGKTSLHSQAELVELVLKSVAILA